MCVCASDLIKPIAYSSKRKILARDAARLEQTTPHTTPHHPTPISQIAYLVIFKTARSYKMPSWLKILIFSFFNKDYRSFSNHFI